jgi:flavin reductase ActVB
MTSHKAVLSAVAADVFRNAMVWFAAPVAILTCHDEDDAPWGLTVTSVTSLSLDPPLVLACLDKRSVSCSKVVSARWFCVNLAMPGQEWMARQFAGPAQDRFRGVDIEPGLAPMLSAAATRLICEHYGVRDGGDHSILLGRVMAVDCPDGDQAADTPALVWHGRDFACTHRRNPRQIVRPG